MNKQDIVIVAAKRTPMGAFQGAFSRVSAVDLGAASIKAAVKEAKLSTSSVDEVYMGCVLPAGLGQAPARQAALAAGLAESTLSTTVNKVCGSGMKAMMMAADQLRLGQAELIVAGGMESMTNAPYLLQKARGGYRMGHDTTYDHMFLDGLEDAYDQQSMGVHAQNTANEYKLSRERLDDFALESLNRSNQAIENGWFKAEITPVTIENRKGDIVVEDDECPSQARPEKIPKLRPVFAKDGTLTAANSSAIADGASALVMTTAEKAEELGIKPIARLVDYTAHAQTPSSFTCAPLTAMKNLLTNNQLKASDIDCVEINEAFASVPLMAMDELGFTVEQVNIAGGACAIGHPLGSSGSRIIVTLIHNLIRQKQKLGLASLCIGGGEATACLIELL